MDTDNSVVRARGGVAGAGWRHAKGGKWETSVIVSTIEKSQKG